MKTIKKLTQKLSSLNASTDSIALGFACGAAISMTPFIGFHSILAVLTALMIRANIIAALIGTIVGNPWTFAFIWPATYETGRLILGIRARENLDFSTILDNLKGALFSFDFSDALKDIEEVILPMAVGSIIFYISAFILSFFIIRHILKQIRQ